MSISRKKEGGQLFQTKKKLEKQDQILNPEWDPGLGRKLV